MEAAAQKEIIKYFSSFEEFYNTSKTCLKICQNCAISINKVIRRCKNIKEAKVTGTPLEVFVGLQSKLLSALHNLISEEVLEIQKQRTQVEESFTVLCNRNQQLLQSVKPLDLSQQTKLITGSPLQPPLEHLLQFSEETITFGAQILAQIDTSLNVLSFKALNTGPLVDNFKISAEWQKKIPEIISYTSFCSENEI